jgi:hypothetical protein
MEKPALNAGGQRLVEFLRLEQQTTPPLPNFWHRGFPRFPQTKLRPSIRAELLLLGGLLQCSTEMSASGGWARGAKIQSVFLFVQSHCFLLLFIWSAAHIT